jgi:mannose-6-phosphate isomerase
MLAAMQELPVSAGDAIFVPAGTPHAIGAGILLVELQEPTDLSVCLEWEPFGLTEDQAHLGLGWDAALPALDFGGWDVAGMAESCAAPAVSGSCLPAAANPYFRAERIHGGDELDAGFAVIVGLDGAGTIGELEFRRGSVLLVPHAAGPLTVGGDVSGIRCRPPDPAAPEGRW